MMPPRVPPLVSLAPEKPQSPSRKPKWLARFLRRLLACWPVFYKRHLSTAHFEERWNDVSYDLWVSLL